MKERFSRRSILTVAGGGAVGLAGCLGNGESLESNNDDADGDGAEADDADGDDAEADDVDGDVADGGDADGNRGDPDDEENPSDWEVQGPPLDASFDVTVAVENLEKPWDLVFASNGDVFLTERPGRIRRGTIEALNNEEPTDGTELAEEPVELPNLAPAGEAGILGLTLHPSYPDPAYVYVFYTADEGPLIDRVVRYNATGVGEIEIVVDDLPGATNHSGGRLAFGPDDHLWISRGDVNDPDASQDPGSLVGSILRVTDDGEPAGSDEAPNDADPRVFSYGHRNVQGLDWMPDGTPIVSEHGPVAGDEVNMLTRGLTTAGRSHAAVLIIPTTTHTTTRSFPRPSRPPESSTEKRRGHHPVGRGTTTIPSQS